MVTAHRAEEATSTTDADEQVRQVLAEAGVGAPSDLVTRAASLEEAYLALSDRLAR